MKTQRPMMAAEEHVVLQFRPRRLAGLPDQRVAINGADTRSLHEPNDLSRYEQPRDQPDDFRHRMLANAAAFAFTIALTAVGLWLAMSIADLRRTQDCALQGLRNCAQIAAPQ
ncbi:MAG: hypothetical protein JSS22_05630 [Proteobacteria bacterium]|nr:hypothetical protein [Pseudomonadota bacterium]